MTEPCSLGKKDDFPAVGLREIEDKSRFQCPVCGTPFPASTGRGRPRICCGDVCQQKAGHEAAERARQRRGERAEWSLDDLMAWADTQPEFPDPW